MKVQVPLLTRLEYPNVLTQIVVRSNTKVSEFNRDFLAYELVKPGYGLFLRLGVHIFLQIKICPTG